MLGVIAFTIRTKIRRQDIFHVMSNLTRKCSFVDFGYSRQDCYWPVILFELQGEYRFYGEYP